MKEKLTPDQANHWLEVIKRAKRDKQFLEVYNAKQFMLEHGVAVTQDYTTGQFTWAYKE